MADIFISYSREDRPQAERLADALNAIGYSVWWDRDLIGGDEFRRTIQNELNSATCVIVIWSRTSVQSNWVLDEADKASHQQKLLPVTYDTTIELPMGFGQIQVQDLSSWTGTSDAPQMTGVSQKIAEIEHGRFRSALIAVGGRATSGSLTRQEAFQFFANLNTSIGGLPIGRFLIGSLGMAGMLAVISAIGAIFVYIFDTNTLLRPQDALVATPSIWIGVMVVRSLYQFVFIMKGSGSRRFLDPDFAFWSILVGLLIVMLAFLIMEHDNIAGSLGETVSQSSFLFLAGMTIIALSRIIVRTAVLFWRSV